MYISTFAFKKIKLLDNMDNLHKLVMQMFKENRSAENVLYAIMDSQSRNVNIIVQSDNKPENIPNELTLLNSKECNSLFDKVHTGTILRIYGIVEPTKRNRRMEQSRNSRCIIKSLHERHDWLKRKFQPAGNLIAINEVGKNPVFVKKKTGDEHKTSFFRYECLLYVRDPDKLKELLRSGIGRSKAYGAGLFLILTTYQP